MDWNFKNCNVRMVAELDADCEGYSGKPYDWYFTVNGQSGFGTVTITGEPSVFSVKFMTNEFDVDCYSEVVERVQAIIDNCILMKE
jgi:hypothetical protein